MTVSFITNYLATSTINTLNIALMSKSITTCSLSRGVFLGAQAFSMSSGVLLIDGLGGHTYDYDKRSPYFIVIGTEGLVILLTISLALCRQLFV